MSDKTGYDFDLDDILAEFSSYSDKLTNDKTADDRPAKPAEEPPAAKKEPAPQVQPQQAKAPVQPGKPAHDKVRAARPNDPRPVKAPVRAEKEQIQRPSPRRNDAAEENEARPRSVSAPVRVLLSVVSFVLMLVLVFWIGANVHPGTESAVSDTAGAAKTDLVNRLNVYMNNLASDALGNLAYIKKQYILDYYTTVAPKPDSSKFGTVSIDEASKVMDVVEQAKSYGLLDGQDVIFDPETKFYWDSDIKYYCDETILVICWKEQINNRVCSCVEVKIADGSQIRRKIMNDTFGSSEWGYASELARSANAVVAMNADFYMYRNLGVCVYQGQIGRFETSCDVLFINADGDFVMKRAGELGDQASLQQFIADNNIQFSMSFGPILVQDGELQQLSGSYAGGMGEMYQQYSRAGIGQYDKLHYLYMTVNHSNDGTPRADVNEFAKIIYSKGVKDAYNFDGGQTSEIVFDGQMYNYVDWGNERLVSDILYFATAIPEQEVG